MVAKRRTVVTFGLVSGLRVSKVSTVTGIGGESWSRNVELSSLLDSSRVFASQKCQQSQGSGGSWSRNLELSSLLDSSRVFASQKCQQSQGSGGVVVAKRRTVVTFGLVSGLRVSKVSTVTGIRGVVVAKRRTVVTFGLVSGLRVSNVSTVTGIGGGSWSRNVELSSLLDSSRVFASQKCQQSQGSGGVVVAKRRTVVTFGLVSGLRVSKVSAVTGIGVLNVSTVTGIRGVVVAKLEQSSLLDSSRVFASQKCQQSQGSGGVVVVKRRTVVTFGLASRERKRERREEKREMRGERREARGEEESG